MQDFISRKIDINGNIDPITVKQYDNNSRYLHVKITDSDLSDGSFDLTGCSAALYVQPENDDDPTHISFITGTVADADGGIVTFLIPGSVTQIVRKYECEIRIYQSNQTDNPIISTKPFDLIVEKSIFNASAMEETQCLSELEGALITANSLIDAFSASNGFVTPEMFGAVAGQDASAALQDCIDYAGSNNKAVLIPNDLSFSQPIQLNARGLIFKAYGTLTYTGEGDYYAVNALYAYQKIEISKLISSGGGIRITTSGESGGVSVEYIDVYCGSMSCAKTCARIEAVNSGKSAVYNSLKGDLWVTSANNFPIIHLYSSAEANVIGETVISVRKIRRNLEEGSTDSNAFIGIFCEGKSTSKINATKIINTSLEACFGTGIYLKNCNTTVIQHCRHAELQSNNELNNRVLALEGTITGLYFINAYFLKSNKVGFIDSPTVNQIFFDCGWSNPGGAIVGHGLHIYNSVYWFDSLERTIVRDCVNGTVLSYLSGTESYFAAGIKFVQNNDSTVTLSEFHNGNTLSHIVVTTVYSGKNYTVKSADGTTIFTTSTAGTWLLFFNAGNNVTIISA